ncbi:MAG: FMN-binding negative transcriptional regulator [Pseudomonadota bacterium]
MHPNPVFRGADAARNIAFARDAGFGILTLAGGDGPLVSHLPYVLDEAGTRARAHIVRSNPIWRKLREGETEAVLIVSGPHGYISPDWYGSDDQVPTWNYVAVHLRGTVRMLPEDALRPHLEELSAMNEARLTPKRPWTLDKMSEDPLYRMMRTIAPIELEIRDVQGTWKLNQNKDDEARLGAMTAVDDPELAALMSDPPR